MVRLLDNTVPVGVPWGYIFFPMPSIGLNVASLQEVGRARTLKTNLGERTLNAATISGKVLGRSAINISTEPLRFWPLPEQYRFLQSVRRGCEKVELLIGQGPYISFFFYIFQESVGDSHEPPSPPAWHPDPTPNCLIAPGIESSKLNRHT